MYIHRAFFQAYFHRLLKLAVRSQRGPRSLSKKQMDSFLDDKPASLGRRTARADTRHCQAGRRSISFVPLPPKLAAFQGPVSSPPWHCESLTDAKRAEGVFQFDHRRIQPRTKW